MKHIIILVVLIVASISEAQDWNTVGGNNQRNGKASFHGPGFDFEVRRKPSLPTIWGNQIFIEGTKLVTTRYLSLNPIRAVLACHSATNLDTIWTRNYADNGVMIVMGFRNGKIYARNFQQQGFDTIYAINPNDGSVIWKSRHTVERGIIWSAVFAENGDLILPGSGTKSVMRVNHTNGDTVWTRYRIIPNTGAECMCIYENTVYTFEGGLTTPKRIMAIDISNGAIKYYSQSLPGDGDQEIPFSIGSDGTIYVVRDGGEMHALRDDGTGFVQLWQRPLPGPVGTYSTFGVMSDNDVLVGAGKRIYKIDNTNGSLVDSTDEVITSGTLNARIGVDAFDYVYVGNGASVPSEGNYFSFNRFLETQWSDPVPFNFYSGPALGYANGVMGVYYCGAGTDITWVADFASVNSQQEELPSSVKLFQNFPNPFNPSTNIRVELQSREKIELRVYDMLGNLVDVVYSGILTAGTHDFKWNAKNVASGVYVCKITSGGVTYGKKMMLLK